MLYDVNIVGFHLNDFSHFVGRDTPDNVEVKHLVMLGADLTLHALQGCTDEVGLPFFISDLLQLQPFRVWHALDGRSG